MKRIIAICLCLVACFALTSCNKDDITVPAGMQLASNTEVPDYTLFVPDGWTVEISTGTTAAYLKDQVNNLLATFTASFNVPANEGITLENYFESYKTEFSEVFGEPKDFWEETTILAGFNAKQYTYTATFGGTEYKFWQVVCFRDGRIYTLTYSSTTEHFEQYDEDMQLILDNFTFKK